jgi:hypothetical protein
MRQLNPGTLETKQCHLAHTQAEFDNADDDETLILEPEWYPFITARFIDIDKVVRLKV